MADFIIEVDNLTKHYRAAGSFFASGTRLVRAVDGVSFAIKEGNTFALVGESGCGKTTITKILLRLEEPTSGVVRFRDKVVHDLTGPDLFAYKRTVQAVFQDPYSSMNPRMPVIDIIAEPLKVHENLSGAALRNRVGQLLTDVGLSPTAAALYAHQFSGGQRQRIAIARALALRPKLMILDEPVSGLDVSIRAQILNLLVDLQKNYGLSYLLISHDLAIVEHMSHTVGVMYVGKLVELSSKETLYSDPLHPYSKALLAAAPQPDPDLTMTATIAGEVASPINPPPGCRFHPRCPIYGESPMCREHEALWRTARPGHWVACHKVEPATQEADFEQQGDAEIPGDRRKSRAAASAIGTA